MKEQRMNERTRNERTMNEPIMKELTMNELIMKEHVMLYVKELHRTSPSRKKLAVSKLEDALKHSLGGASGYQRAGGYGELYAILVGLAEQGRLEPIKSAGGNGRQPELRAMYWSIPENGGAGWSGMDKLKLSNRLSLAAYERQPGLQTAEELERVSRVYRFLGDRDQRAWVTREERSLELFGNEKWLGEEQGHAFLRRLGLSLNDLRARVHGEPFVFWPRPGIRLQEAGQALVVENLSLFHTVLRTLELDGHVLGLQPELLIYGEGKKIESSLAFLIDLVGTESALALTVLYAGDVDPEGWSIYLRLKRRYANIDIRLAVPFYEAMAGLVHKVPIKAQLQQAEVIDSVMEELREAGASEALASIVGSCWAERLRLPQEVLNIETIRSGRSEARGGSAT